MLAIHKDKTEPLYQQIYRQIAADIEQGLYQPGEHLPSLRQNATLLDVSRNTVEQAYQMLTQEGYVDARPGSGYVVNRLKTRPRRSGGFDTDYEASLHLLQERDTHRTSKVDYDFAYDRMDPEIFPLHQWTRATRNVLEGPYVNDMCSYGDRRGIAELRQQIAQYLTREEDIRAVPEQILIQSTTRAALTTILHLFDPHDTTVAIENPGFPDAVNACRMVGFGVVPHSVFPENRWDNFVDRDCGARLVYCTPSSQYPTNAIMKLSDREALVQWAQETGSYIIEDVYCHEFRYQSAHLPSLHALDTSGRVIVVGTFSKSLAPSMCISYVVLPPALMMRWMGPRSLMHPPVPWQMQATLAEFMKEGHWYQHLHKLQTAYRNKYRELTDALNQTMGDRIEYLDYENGLHVLLATKDGRGTQELRLQAARAGVRIYPTEQDFIGDVPENWRYVLLGYGSIPVEKIRPGIEALAHAWGLS